jgi:hypothetical protein
MKNWGFFLIIISIVLGYIAFTMDTSVEIGGTYEYGTYIPKTRINNIGLMSQQTNLLIGAGISFISGILLIGFSFKSGASFSKEVRTCPYCAEQVNVQATICRFCQKNLPPLSPNSDSLKHQILMLRVGNFSYQMIAHDFNEKNMPIPERYAEFDIWSPELVELVEREKRLEGA